MLAFWRTKPQKHQTLLFWEEEKDVHKIWILATCLQIFRKSMLASLHLFVKFRTIKENLLSNLMTLEIAKQVESK